MQVPADYNWGPDDGYQQKGQVPGQAPPDLLLNPDSQLRLHELYRFLSRWRAQLDEIRADLSLVNSTAGSSDIPRRCAEKMKAFCLDMEAWRFDDLYKVAWRIQMLLIDLIDRVSDADCRKALHSSLNLLSHLLDY